MLLDDAVRAVEERPRIHELLRMREGILREVPEKERELRFVLDRVLPFRLGDHDAPIRVIQHGILRDPMPLQPGSRDHGRP